MGHRSIAAASLAAALMLSAAPALAQSQAPRPGQIPPPGAQRPPQGQPQQAPAAAPAKPYKAVAVTPAKPVADPSFEAFRKQMSAAAEKKDRKALADLVSKSFFWMGEKGDKADKKKPGIDNLARAINLDAKDGSGWDTVIGFASDPTGGPFPERKGVICAPAEPGFNGQELEALAKATGTDEAEWAYPFQPIDMRASAQPNAPVVEKLGMHFIRVMEEDAPAGGDNPMIKVVAPSGKTGYVPADAISPLGNDAMCYAKEGANWKITGFLGGE